MSGFTSVMSALALGLAVAFMPAPAQAAEIDPTDMRGLRDLGAGPFLLDFSAVKGGTEDRTIAHFDITGVGAFASARLSLSLLNLDSFDGTLDILSFAGDGLVSADEWDAGSYQGTITGIGGSLTTQTFDITSLLQTAVADGQPWLSLNLLNAPASGRFFLGHTIDGSFGTISSAGRTFIDLTPVPLPAGALLLISGPGMLLALRRRKARARH
ncbi:hypothetical protein [Roseobacter ponti]|uniref:VPLPA-CTERM sorting domain-containing protein n=1 Tax=Roseobacter ponti TaxID=1891787 RepID=A0A858SS79_9RHOB|nr:hypothetical protein [Roseobacter ponti]QJF51525.1 hypothetical protein G3256_10300 [Roseobacter ponti]